MTEQDIKEIHSQYPWASEATLAGILARSKSQGQQSLRKVNQILKKLGLDELDNIAKAMADDEQQIFDNLEKLSDATVKHIHNLQRDSDPLGAMAELLNTTGKAVGGAGNMLGKIPGIGGRIGIVASAAGKVIQATAGAASVLGSIANEQEKMTRAMIEYGLAVRDLDEFTDMRGSLARVGMSMGELTQVLENNKGTFAQISDDTYSGTRDFVNFAAEVEKQNVEHGGDFGYGVEELTKRLAEETRILFQINGMTTLDAMTKKKIKENFMKSSAMTTFMANATGEQRSAMLKARAEAAANIDFRQAMVQNANFISETLGKEALDNINNAQQQMSMMMGVLVPSMKEETDALFTESVRDLHLDQTSINNAKGPLLDKLALLGGDVQQEYFRIMDASITGKLTGTDLVVALQGLARKIQKAQTRQSGTDQTIQEANRTIAEARRIPKSFMDLSEEQIRAGEAATLVKTEAADNAIDAIDGARKAFRNTLHTISPGYSSMSDSLDVFVSTVDGFGDVLSVFGIGYKNPRLEAEEKMKDVIKTDTKLTAAKQRLNETLRKANESSGIKKMYYDRAAKSQAENITRLEESKSKLLGEVKKSDASKVPPPVLAPKSRSITPQTGGKADWNGVRMQLAAQGITDNRAVANIMAQMQAESRGDATKQENLNYSAERLMQVFPNKFSSLADARAVVAGGPEAIGNRIYGGRMGNAADEGYLYRGRGLIQLTGKNNYEKYGKMLGIDLVGNPDMASDPVVAQKIAAMYFSQAQARGTDLTDIRQVGKAVGYVDHGGGETNKRAGLAGGFLDMLSKLSTSTPAAPASKPAEPPKPEVKPQPAPAVPNDDKNKKDVSTLRQNQLKLAALKAMSKRKSLSSYAREQTEREIRELESILREVNDTFETDNLHSQGA